jgi:hypothetical protein
MIEYYWSKILRKLEATLLKTVIFTKHPSYLFIVVIFLQAFSQNMFSGSLYGTSWLAISAALIINFNKESV